jgi:glycosyltransferase involved in cell wall biosynthesis
MKILHIVESFSGGIITFLRLLINETSDLEHIVLYGNRQSGIEHQKKSFNAATKFILWEAAQRNISISKDVRAYYNMSNIISKEIPNVIHLHSSKAGFLGRLWGGLNKQERSPLILYTPHGLPFVRKDISLVKRQLYISLEKLAANLSGQIIAVSDSEKNELSVNNILATYINNGIKVDYGWKKGVQSNSKISIVTVGRICEQKNPKLFSKIADAFRNNSDVEFIWIGDGELRTQLSQNIRITGWLKENDVQSLLGDASIYLSTALWEGLPFAVLEAMNKSLGLLLYNCIGNCDLVCNGHKQNGLLFCNHLEVITIIKELIKSPDLIESWGIKSFQLLEEKFTADNMADQYKDIYNTANR